MEELLYEFSPNTTRIAVADFVASTSIIFSLFGHIKETIQHTLSILSIAIKLKNQISLDKLIHDTCWLSQLTTTVNPYQFVFTSKDNQIVYNEWELTFFKRNTPQRKCKLKTPDQDLMKRTLQAKVNFQYAKGKESLTDGIP